MALPSAVNRAQVSANAVALRLASGMRDELVTIVREMLTQNTVAGRLAYSPDEAAELLGISRELIHDLLRTGQLGSVKAGRRRLISTRHLEEFLASER
jgi:excisionase family DNA binding protein